MIIEGEKTKKNVALLKLEDGLFQNVKAAICVKIKNICTIYCFGSFFLDSIIYLLEFSTLLKQSCNYLAP